MHGAFLRAAMLAGLATIGSTAQVKAQAPAAPAAPPLREPPSIAPPRATEPPPARQAQPLRIQCSPRRVSGTQCPQPSGACPDTTLGIGGNYVIDAARRGVTRYDEAWTQPQRMHVSRAVAGELVTEESDRYFSAYVTMTFRLGDGNTPVTYVHSIYPIAANRAAAASDQPLLRSEGTCAIVPQQRR